MSIPFIKLKNSVILNVNNKTITVTEDSKEYPIVLEAIKEGTVENIIHLLDKETSIKNIKNTNVEVKNGKLYIDGDLVSNYVATKIMEFISSGLPCEPLVNFWRKLKQNPSENSKEQLYRFLESAECPITPEGNFICMKGVNPTDDPNVFVSGHNKKYAYTLGVMSYMDRKEIPDSPNTACGPGLHGGSYSYAKNWASVVIELLVDPADVVSVPYDHNSEKLRACRVLPLNVHSGNKYTKGLVIDAVEEETTEVSTVSEELANKDDFFIVNRVTCKVVDTDLHLYNKIYDGTLNTVYNIQRYRASKVPVSIKNKFSYIEECYKFNVHSVSDAVYVVKYKDIINEMCFSLVFSSDINDIKVLLEGHVKEKEKEKDINTSFFTKGGEFVITSMFIRMSYELVLVKNDKVLTDVFDSEQDFISSYATIKPSKLPVSVYDEIKNRSIKVNKAYRVTLGTSDIVFVIDTPNGVMLFRPVSFKPF